MKVPLPLILVSLLISACASTPALTNQDCEHRLDALGELLQAAFADIDAAAPVDMATSVALGAGLNASTAEVMAAIATCGDRTSEADTRCEARFSNLASLLNTASSELARAGVSNASAKASATTKLVAASDQLQAANNVCTGHVQR